MTAEPAVRIRLSHASIAVQAPQLIDLFYSRLFLAMPSLRTLFPGDMTQQRVHMIAALSLIAENADHIESLAIPLIQMGERHARYGARPEHYAVVRDALLGALATVSGPNWNEQLAADWRAAFDQVAALMLEGAERVQAARRAA